MAKRATAELGQQVRRSTPAQHVVRSVGYARTRRRWLMARSKVRTRHPTEIESLDGEGAASSRSDYGRGPVEERGVRPAPRCPGATATRLNGLVERLDALG